MGLRILIAEDEPVARAVLELLFKRSSYRVDFAEDGFQAVEMWATGVYAMVLMDIQMPRIDGCEAARTIREREKETGGRTPIVAMTAHSRKEEVERCLAVGMDAHISKPLDFTQCLQLIERVLNRSPDGTCHR